MEEVPSIVIVSEDEADHARCTFSYFAFVNSRSRTSSPQQLSMELRSLSNSARVYSMRRMPMVTIVISFVDLNISNAELPTLMVC